MLCDADGGRAAERRARDGDGGAAMAWRAMVCVAILLAPPRHFSVPLSYKT